MKKIAVVLWIICVCGLFGMCSYAAVYTEATKVAYDVPVRAVLPDGKNIDVVKYKSNFLCFPGNVELSEVSFVYTGSEKLYLAESDVLVEPGGSFSFELVCGECVFYEYVESKDVYYSYDVTVMQGSDVSALYIEFDDSYSFDVLSYLAQSKEYSVKGSLYMTDSDGDVLYDGDLDTFKCRGNTSFTIPGVQGDKLSFNMKLANKTELIPGAGEMKKWSLLHMRLSTAYNYDLTGLTSILGLGTYEALCDDGYYTNKIECVDVYIEGKYRGAYLLVERLDVNAAVDITDSEKYLDGEHTGYGKVAARGDSAIDSGVQWYTYSEGVSPTDDLDISGGYIVEVNASPDGCGFTTSRGITFEIKAPEICTKEQVQYIASYVQEFEDALYSSTGYNDLGKHYSEYADVKSMVDCVLTYGFYQNWELMRTSTYIYKDVDGSDRDKLTFGPVWDFETGSHTFLDDTTLFGKHYFYEEYRQYAWIEQMWSHADFMNVAYEQAWAISEYMHDMLDGEDALVYDIVDRQMDSMNMNWARWDVMRAIRLTGVFSELDNTYASHVQFHIDALRTRLERWDDYWSEEYLLGAKTDSVYDEATGEYTITVTPIGKADECYWYSVDENGESNAISGENGFSLTTAEPGIYYCAISGKNNNFYKYASGRVFSEKVITMTAVHALSAPEASVQSVGSFPLAYVLIGVGVVLAVIVSAAAMWLMFKRKK